MSLPAGYYRIDPDIRALVAAMNVHGFRTYASCQGHGQLQKLPPYIAFACPVKMAGLLEQRLRQDAELYGPPRLIWGWSVKGLLTVIFSFASGFSLKAPHHWYRYCRRSLRADFRTLVRLVNP